MSESTSDESSGTLYDPPSGNAEPSTSGEDTVSLRLSLPKDRIERLQAVAQQLGLPPSTIAKRAIEMVCDEVVTIQNDNRPPALLIDQYQARIDLLHSVEEALDAESTDTLESNPPSDDPSHG